MKACNRLLCTRWTCDSISLVDSGLRLSSTGFLCDWIHCVKQGEEQHPVLLRWNPSKWISWLQLVSPLPPPTNPCSCVSRSVQDCKHTCMCVVVFLCGCKLAYICMFTMYICTLLVACHDKKYFLESSVCIRKSCNITLCACWFMKQRLCFNLFFSVQFNIIWFLFTFLT